MRVFHTERDAKEYLIQRIEAEAKSEGVPLSEVERKMLYFTETGWTLPDIMEVNAEFERDYDNDEYEQKVLNLAQAIERHNKGKGGADQATWDDAVVKLSEGDHYLLVLINPRLVGKPSTKRPPGDLLKLVLTAVGVVAIIFVAMVLLNR